MHLVDYKDNVSRFLGFTQKCLHSLLKLPSKLCSRNYSSHIDKVKLLAAQLIRDITRGNSLRKCLCDRRFSDSGFTDETRVIFLTAAEYLYDTSKLILTPDYAVKLSAACKLGQIFAVFIEKIMFF